ncbi:MAG: S8 family serine peptidase, partial [Planctomycetota bacterium]
SFSPAQSLRLSCIRGTSHAPAREAFRLDAGSRLRIDLGIGERLTLAVVAGAPASYRLELAPASKVQAGAPLPAQEQPAVLPPSVTAELWRRTLGGFEQQPGEFLFSSADPRAAQVLESLGCVKLDQGGSVERWCSPAIRDMPRNDSSRLATADLLNEIRRALPAARFVSPNLASPLSDLAGNQPAASGPATVPNDPLFKHQWNMRLCRFDQAWDQTVGKDSVHIAIMDTGIDVEHPDLKAGISTWSYDFVSDPVSAGDNDGPDPDPSEPPSFGPITFFHGTYVSGVCGALSNNNEGISGGVWRGKILMLRIFGKLGGTSFDRIQAWRYVAGLANSSNKILPEAERPRILSMSFGSYVATSAELQAVRQVADAGVIMLAAAGNGGLDPAPPQFPAAWEEVIGVGAVDEMALRAPYSNVADFVEISAPGGLEWAGPRGVTSTWAVPVGARLDHVYNSFSGTSLAAPLVAAGVALMEAVHPRIALPTVRRVLELSSRDLGPIGKDPEYGFGLLDADEAVNRARELNRPPLVGVTPTLLDFGRDLTASSVQILNLGGRVLEGFKVVPLGQSSNALGFSFSRGYAPATLDVSLDREGLPVGDYRERVSLETNAGSVELAFVFRQPIPAPGGAIRVNLFDGARLVQTALAAPDGSFEIPNVRPGHYRLEAGVDRDGNGKLGDAEEWYLSLAVRVGATTVPELSALEIPWKH